MTLFVDDIRQGPDGALVARTIGEAKKYLSERADIDTVSLDHDMGACAACSAAGLHVGDMRTPDMRTPETTYMNWCPHAEDGYALVMWMIEHQRIPATVYVHSMNPVGKARMLAALASA